MIVLKFGGTSVANAQNIQRVIKIVSEKAQQDELVVVVSALSGVTDMLIDASLKAAKKDELYKQNIEEIKQKHLDTISDLVAVSNQHQLLGDINNHLYVLQTLLDGCFLLGELTPRTADAIAGFGELLSSQIIATAIQQVLPNTSFKDSRELIETNSIWKSNCRIC